MIGEGRLVHQMRREQHRQTRLRPQHVPHVDARGRVEAGAGFVEQHDLRSGEQALGDLDTAAQTARQFADPIVGPVGEARRLEQRADPFVELVSGETDQQPAVAQVLAHRQLVVDGRRLEHDAEPFAHRGRVLGEVAAEHRDPTLLHRRQRRQQFEQRRLAGAIGPEEAVYTAARDREANAIERLAFPVVERDGLGVNGDVDAHARSQTIARNSSGR